MTVSLLLLGSLLFLLLSGPNFANTIVPGVGTSIAESPVCLELPLLRGNLARCLGSVDVRDGEVLTSGSGSEVIALIVQ